MLKKREKRRFEQSGTFRQERAQDSLWADSTPIDERSLPELLDYVLKVAAAIPFFNLQDEYNGHGWDRFFKGDISFIVAQISVYDLKRAEEKLIRHSLNVNRYLEEQQKPEGGPAATSGQPPEHKDGFEAFKKDTLLLVALLEKWYKATKPYEQKYEIAKVIFQTVEKIKEDWEQIFRDTSSSPHQVSAAKPNLFVVIRQLLSSFEGPITSESFSHLRFVYRSFFRAVSTIVSFARQTFPKTLEKPDHLPQAALLITFLKLFQLAQDHLNSFTQRHLDYYYEQILGAKRKEAEADYTFLGLHLRKDLKRMVLPAGTRFFASINNDGLETLYETRTDVNLNQAVIKHCHTIFLEKDPDIDLGSSFAFPSGIYAGTVEPAAELPEKGSETEISWPTFGESPGENDHGHKRTEAAPLGFALSSPVFLLRGGKRKIRLSLLFETDSYSTFKSYIEDIAQNQKKSFQGVIHQLFGQAFDISITSSDDSLNQLNYQIEAFADHRGEGFQLDISFQETAAPIVAMPTFHGDQLLQSDWPCLKILLKKEENLFVYPLLEVLRFQEIQVDVKAEGVKNLMLFNELGQLNNDAPFFPFGPLPNRRSYLLFACDELKYKKLDHLAIYLDWFDLPDEEGGFTSYYKEYPYQMENEDFLISLSALSDYRFSPFSSSERQVFPIFTLDEEEKLKYTTSLTGIQRERLNWTPEFKPVEPAPYTNNTRSGYFRLELINPEVAFGHSVYPQLFANATIENVTKSRGGLFRRKKSETPMPREPYTPKAQQLAIDYASSSILKFDPLKARENSSKSGEKVFLLHPFGTEETFSGGTASSNHFLPSYKEQGNLFIGLEGVSPPQRINLFFKLKTRAGKYIAPGSVKPAFSFLSSNKWIPFPPEDILSDGTRSFTTSGIITLKIGTKINRKNSILDSSLHWLKISVDKLADQISETQLLTTNAAKVFWVVHNDPDHFSQTASRDRIKELYQQNSAIDEVLQIDDFLGGKPPELPEDFLIRVSERLRHKNRAVNQWDYEHLVLEQFPEISQVKCIGYNQYKPFAQNGSQRIQPGQTTVVIVPENTLADQTGGNINLLNQVGEFLKKRASAFVDVNVIYPTFEKIRINGLVRFQDTEDQGILLEKLLQELKEFICPWLQGGPLPLGESLNIYNIYRFVESRPYVLFFTEFSVIHLFGGESQTYELEDSYDQEKSSGIIQARQPWSAITPLSIQGIQPIESSDYKKPRPHTLGRMYVDNDVFVNPSPDDSGDLPS
jgi:hypothetical protein